jgi:hypothetical protein
MGKRFHHHVMVAASPCLYMARSSVERLVHEIPVSRSWLQTIKIQSIYPNQPRYTGIEITRDKDHGKQNYNVI